MKTILYFFGLFHDDDIHWFAKSGQVRTLAPGEALIRQGVPLDDLFIVLEGQARIALADGRRVATRSTGDMLGEMSFVDAAPPSATVTALDSLTVLAMNRDRMRARLESEPAFAARFYRALAILLSDRLRAATGQGGDGLAPDELDETVLDTLSMAGTRFNDLLAALGRA